jgi:acyl-CoA thioesterase I
MSSFIRLATHLAPTWARRYDGCSRRVVNRAAFVAVLLYGVALDPALNQGDGLHPTARGVDAIVARMTPAVERLIGSRG